MRLGPALPWHLSKKSWEQLIFGCIGYFFVMFVAFNSFWCWLLLVFGATYIQYLWGLELLIILIVWWGWSIQLSMLLVPIQWECSGEECFLVCSLLYQHLNYNHDRPQTLKTELGNQSFWPLANESDVASVYLKANWQMRLVVQTQYQQGKGYSTVKWLENFYWQIRWTCIIDRKRLLNYTAENS